MTVTFDSSFLLNYYNAKAGLPPSTTGTGITATSTTPAAPVNPTPPWTKFTTVQANALTQSVLNGARFIDPSAAKLDVTGAGTVANQNYKNLFALYQGLNALNGIARLAAATTTPGPAELARLQTTFQSGLQQIQSYLGGKPFSGFQVLQSDAVTTAKAASLAPKETDTYTTGAVYSGTPGAPVPAFQGDVKFAVTATKVSGSQTTVNFDLSEMGSTPRTMGSVVSYLNGKLEDAGLATRFASVMTPGTPNTTQVGGKTITLSQNPNQYALQIKGVSVEDLSFSASATEPAVYVAQTSGITAGKTPDATQQLVKFDTGTTPLATTSATGQVFSKTLDASASAVHAIATAPDGSVYALTNVTAAAGGQSIQGGQDVALVKYDSAGNVVYTRTLGAAGSASGLALSVSPDGSQVAIVGSTTSDLDPSDGVAKAPTGGAPNSSFVTVFNATGQELWTKQTLGASGAAVQANAVAFGANGMVYVAGQTDGALQGATTAGRTDGFIQAYHAVATPLNDGSGGSLYTVANSYTSQFGTGGQDQASGLVVSGSSVYVASTESGHAVVRQFDQSGTGSTSLTASTVRDLGDLQGGSVAGIAANPDGSIVVAGSTHNGALDAGTITQAYAGGKEAFIASLAPDLQPAAGDRLTYVGAPTDQSVSAVTVSGGQVFITGQIATTPVPGSTQTDAFDGYASEVDPQTGQVSWTRRYTGQDREMAPTSIAVGQAGASALDLLGLPSGAVDYDVSQQLVANTAVRAGDEFFVKSGQNGAPVAVKIAANDTYQTLAQKIARATGFNAKATVVAGVAGAQLQIKASYPSAQVQIIAGPKGADALQALGLSEGVITANADQMSALAPVKGSAAAAPTSSLKNGYSLKLPTNLDLTTPTGVKTAQGVLMAALTTVVAIYRDMTTPPPAKVTPGSSGAAPKYLTDKIANYQAALDRLTGGQ